MRGTIGSEWIGEGRARELRSGRGWSSLDCQGGESRSPGLRTTFLRVVEMLCGVRLPENGGTVAVGNA